MKNYPYHSWKAPCSFHVATGKPRIKDRHSPDVLGGYTDGTRWDTKKFHPCTPGRIIDSPPPPPPYMPVRQGPRRMHARCIHGDAGDNTDDTGDNTDDPGATILDDP